MKEIKAVIRPNKLTALRDALRTVPGFPGMTVTKAEGCSAPARRPGNSIKEELTDYTPKVRLEIVAEDQVAEALFQRIIQVTQTGQVGDGLVWMTDIHKAAFIFKTTPGAEGL